MSSRMISKTRLINLATPDTNISTLQTSNPQLHTAIKNLGNASKQLINNSFPPPPSILYRGQIILPGTQTVSTDILVHRHHIVLPIDVTSYWTYNQINLLGCYITAKTVPFFAPLSVDILISQQKGTTAYKSLFQPGFNPILPVGVVTTNNVKFAINTLFQDDLGRVDILSTDTVVADIELILVGNYSVSENQIT
jgi:hypothetical protein